MENIVFYVIIKRNVNDQLWRLQQNKPLHAHQQLEPKIGHLMIYVMSLSKQNQPASHHHKKKPQAVMCYWQQCWVTYFSLDVSQN